MSSLKTIVVTGSLGLAALGVGSGVANAEPSPAAPPPVVSSEDPGQGDGPTAGWAPPSPYATYGAPSICATPGLSSVNICT